MGNIQISSMVSGIARIVVARRTLLLEEGRDLSETSLSVAHVVSFPDHHPVVPCRCSRFSPGKYWHRHRRPRPVEYSTDPEFHLRRQAKGGNDEGNSKAVNSKKKKPQPVVDESKYEEADAIAPTTAANVAKLEAQTASVLPHPLDDRPLSPVSTASSESEPLSQSTRFFGRSSSLLLPIKHLARNSIYTIPCIQCGLRGRSFGTSPMYSPFSVHVLFFRAMTDPSF